MEFAFWEFDEEDFPLVHHRSEIELVFFGGENIFDDIDGEDLSDFVEDRHDRFGVELLRPSGKFVGPEVPDDIIPDSFDHRVAEILVGEGTDDIKECRIFFVEQREEDHTEDVLEFRIPVGAEEFFEDVDESLREDLFGFPLFHIERIEAKRELLIGRIEDNDIVFPRFWDIGKCFLEEISMGIDDPESLSALDVIDEKISDEFGFPNPSLTYDIGMSEPVLIVYSDRDTDGSIIRYPNHIHIRFYIFREHLPICFYFIRKGRNPNRECEFFRGDFQEACFALWSLWEVVKRGDFFGAQNIFFHRSITIDNFIERWDIAVYSEIKLIERIIFENEEIIENRFYSRSRGTFVIRFCEDKYFRFKEFLMEFVMKIGTPYGFPVFLGLEIENIFKKLESESDSEKEKREPRLEIKPDTILFYRHKFDEKSKFIMHHVEVLKRPENIEDKVGVIRSVYFKRKKPAIFKGDFSEYGIFWVVMKNPLVVFYNLKVIKRSVELGFKGGICFFFACERIKIFSFQVIESEYNPLSLKRFSYFIEEILEDTLSFVVSVIEFDEIILHDNKG